MIQLVSLPVVPHLEQLVHELREIAGALELVQVVLEPEPREPVYPALLVQDLHEGPLLELRQLLHGDRLVLELPDALELLVGVAELDRLGEPVDVWVILPVNRIYHLPILYVYPQS